MSTCVGSKPNVEPMPRRTTGHLWGGDAEFSPSPLSKLSLTDGVYSAYSDLKQRGACSLCLGDSILMAVKWRTSNSVVLAAIDNACRRPSAHEEARSS
ncbi:uncharacterized protein BDZ99DRAFT_467883 [Mytilinidion resinicola]|uniref:Uncharacterized protein n=1 Tax=Mytilinidion resinicola TaxID=574789 RepID=A0A6A6Y4N4_9PEZI|nr:uncharacterized protein BDZ99DRAFT_467883 [Mytilinidion resinicola]KAF2803752.1 hypothetical protein BDZ99DRAFT_467883 [Mytilinidion resinicola]